MNKSKREISQIGLYLNKRYDVYLEEKSILLNHRKMVEYLFNKPTIKINSLKDLLLIDYDSTIRLVRLEKKDKITITSQFFLLWETIKKYSSVYQTYQDLLHSMKSKRYFNCLPIIQELPEIKQNIIKILDQYEYRYKISYLCQWSFYQEGEHLVLTKLPTVNLEQKFVYDFYGIMINHGQLIQFVIEYDDDSMNEQQHISNIIKQFILFQKNINLLRLNKNSNIKKEIVDFIRKIKNTSKYVSQNSIRPIARLFNSSSINPHLVKFCVNYEYNHIVYLKMPTKKILIYDSDDEDFFDQHIKANVELTDPADDEYTVSQNIIFKIIEEKKDLHPVKRSEVDDILVELIGIK